MLLHAAWLLLHGPRALAASGVLFGSCYDLFLNCVCSGHFHLSHNYADAISVVNRDTHCLGSVGIFNTSMCSCNPAPLHMHPQPRCT